MIYPIRINNGFFKILICNRKKNKYLSIKRKIKESESPNGNKEKKFDTFNYLNFYNNDALELGHSPVLVG